MKLRSHIRTCCLDRQRGRIERWIDRQMHTQFSQSILAHDLTLLTSSAHMETHTQDDFQTFFPLLLSFLSSSSASSCCIYCSIFRREKVGGNSTYFEEERRAKARKVFICSLTSRFGRQPRKERFEFFSLRINQSVFLILLLLLIRKKKIGRRRTLNRLFFWGKRKR